MVLVSEQVHPRGLDFKNQRRVILLRQVKKLSFPKIRARVVNLQGKRPSRELLRRTYAEFNKTAGRRKSNYKNCGRKKWKVSPEVRRFLIQRLLFLRKEHIVTSTTLQQELASKKKVQLETSTIRRVLKGAGYSWLPRAKKLVYDKNTRADRVAFADRILKMTQAELDEWLSFDMDGVVLTMPPTEPVARDNYCRVGESHVWRKPSESGLPELSGGNAYGKQVPAARAVNMWAGVGRAGCAIVCFHDQRKIKAEDWARHVDEKKLEIACQTAQNRRRGPWRVLCDNETFLEAPASRKAHKRAGVRLLHIPPRSPDLNPAEKMWAWMRKRLRAMDLADLREKKPPVDRAKLQRRVRALFKSEEANRVAANLFRGLRGVCQQVKKNKGAATRG